MPTWRILLLVVVVLAASGCSSIRGERVTTGFGRANQPVATETAAREPSSVAPSASLVSESAPVPVSLGDANATASFDFEARELYSGAIVEGSELFGQGQVLVTFVQPGCDITVEGGATIAEVAEAHPEAIFVIVHSGADDDAYKAFAEQSMLFQENMMHLSDTYGSLAARYSIDAYPTTLLIDSELRITSVTGAMNQDSHRDAVQAVTKPAGVRVAD